MLCNKSENSFTAVCITVFASFYYKLFSDGSESNFAQLALANNLNFVTNFITLVEASFGCQTLIYDRFYDNLDERALFEHMLRSHVENAC